MTRAKPINIVGGGLAGLALGIGLRRRGVPVTVREAGKYPRHRVCGEFICGVASPTLERLGITKAFDAQVTNRDSCWFHRGRPILKKRLPLPAIGISRYELDQRLAEIFTDLGGELLTGERVSEKQRPGENEGTVWFTGRRRTKEGDWLGLKCHLRGFSQTMDTDLQMHIGRRSYVGISQVENGTANLCGLFRKQSTPGANGREGRLLAYLAASGLADLADQIAAPEIEIVPESLLGVSAFQLGHQDAPASQISIGDAYAMIPPFTGNGMSMAFQSAAIALGPLAEYAAGESSWRSARAQIASAHRRQFDRRLRCALAIHAPLLKPLGQRALVTAARLNAVPFGLFFKLTR